jgi:hypothetical protein
MEAPLPLERSAFEQPAPALAARASHRFGATVEAESGTKLKSADY